MNFTYRMFSGSVLDPKFRSRSRFVKIMSLRVLGPYFNFKYGNLPRSRRLRLTKKYLEECHSNIEYTEETDFLDLRVISAFGLQVRENRLVVSKYTLSNPGFNLEKIYSRINYFMDQPTQISDASITAFTTLPFNFYHFMTDFVLPYIAQTDKQRKLFLPFRPTSRQVEILELFSIEFTNANFQANHVLRNTKILPTIFEERQIDWEMSTNPSDNYKFSGDRLKKARETILELNSGKMMEPKGKIFISRKGATRCPEGIFEIEQVFRSHGFQIYNVEDFSFDMTIKMFQDAHLVVGIHGAGLTNMIFAHGGCQIVEVAPDPHKMGGEVRPIFELMARELGFGYKKSRMPQTLEKWAEFASDL